jgi:DNA-binding MarR family transcriptional regulator
MTYQELHILLPPVRRKLLLAIDEMTRTNGYAPTMAELGRVFGVARQTIWQAVSILEKNGLVARSPWERRTLSVTSLGNCLIGQVRKEARENP